MSRSWFRVRVREKVGSDKWVKKTKFYFARNSQDAAEKYKGSGNVMYSQKVGRERSLGLGDFFVLGDKIMRELREGGGALEEAEHVKELERDKIKQRGHYARERKKSASQFE